MKHYFRSVVAASAALFTSSAFAAQPLPPSEVTAQSTPEGVVIAWQPVTEDIDENAVDPEEVIYDVYRCDISDEKVLVGTDLVTTTYTDVLGEISGEVYYRWQVIAKTADGSSSQYEGYSPQLGFGDGASLPYIEKFNSKSGWSMGPDNYWLGENTVGYSDFDVDKELYFDNNGQDMYIRGVDYTEGNDDGFLYFEPSAWSDADTFYTSGGINLGTAENPVISFNYYVIPEGHNSYQVSILDANGDAHEIVDTTPDGEKIGWNKTNDIPLTEFKGQKIRIQIHSSYYPDSAPSTGRRVPICLDNFSVNEGVPTGIENVGADESVKIIYYSIDGRQVENPASGQLLIKVQQNADGSRQTVKTIIR